MALKITMAASKGGTGKTTTAAALAQAAKHDSKKVLCVDMDSQGNLSQDIGGDVNRPGAYHLLHGVQAADLIQPTDQGIDLICASMDLTDERTKTGSSLRLDKALDPLDHDYDIIIIDCPPQLGELVLNGLAAADIVIIPLLADTLSLQGLYMTADTVAHVQERQGRKYNLVGSVICNYDQRPNLHRYLHDEIAKAGEEAGAPLIGTIRRGVAVQEAQATQQSLYDHAPKSKPAQDYMDLYKRLCKEV